MKQNTIEELETRITRIEAVLEIEKLQYKYQQWLALGHSEKIVELFSKNSTALGGDVKEYFSGLAKVFKKMPGMLVEHYAICPVIEVAEDGKTAKGTWLSPGIGVMAPVQRQVWQWGKYACDFIKEDGKWKIWHLEWALTFITDFHRGPLYDQFDASRTLPESDTGIAKEIREGIIPRRGISKPLRPPYSPNEINYLTPEPPEPYNTFE